ncbi:MAG: hypothetical protein ACI3XR_03265 [Eubacteriales bacterium]
MKGKDKCKILKEIRAQIAAANDIEWVTDNCSHKGECRGTCPKCEAEVAKLERELARRQSLGKTVAVAGIAVGMVMSMSACDELPLQTEATDYRSEASESDRPLSTDSTTSLYIDEIDGEIASPITEIPLGGDPACPVFNFDDFTPCTPRMYEALMPIYSETVCDSEGKNLSVSSIRDGSMFEIVGETEDLWLALMNEGYYAIWKYDLTEKSAVEICLPLDPDSTDTE